MDYYNLARGLHILAVIAWMAGMLFLPRLFAYDAEQKAKPEPLRGEMQALLRTWQTRLLRIIINPAMILAFVFGGWLLWLRSGEGGRLVLCPPALDGDQADGGLPAGGLARLPRRSEEEDRRRHFEIFGSFLAHDQRDSLCSGHHHGSVRDLGVDVLGR